MTEDTPVLVTHDEAIIAKRILKDILEQRPDITTKDLYAAISLLELSFRVDEGKVG